MDYPFLKDYIHIQTLKVHLLHLKKYPEHEG